MSKGNGYVPIDKNLTQELNNIGRSFTRLEAMFSYTVDQDNGKGGSINGYAQLWNWSRNKTRKFLKEIRTVKGHQKDSRRTPDGQAVHFIDKALWVSKDSERTVKGHQKDSERDTTIDPNPFPNPNPILKPKEKDLKPSCPEPEKPLDSEPKKIPILKILLIKRDGEFSVFQEDVSQWQETFPGIDVLQILREIKLWNFNNPKKRKTKSGIRAHISSWMAKEQNKSGKTGSQSPQIPKATTVYQADMLQKEIVNQEYLRQRRQEENGKSNCGPPDVIDIENSPKPIN